MRFFQYITVCVVVFEEVKEKEKNPFSSNIAGQILSFHFNVQNTCVGFPFESLIIVILLFHITRSRSIPGS